MDLVGDTTLPSNCIETLDRTPTMNTNSKTEAIYIILLEGIQLLAADFENQVAALPGFVHVPDEVLNEFCESFHLATRALDAGRITPEQYQQMGALHSKLALINVSNDYSEALYDMKHGAQWDALRMEARQVLEALKVPLTTPNLGDKIDFSSNYP